MTNFLFWNVNKKPIAHLIATIAVEHSIDILILAESEIGIAKLLVALNDNQSQKYSLTFSPNERLLVLTRFPGDCISPLLDAGGLSVRQVTPPVGLEILLVGAHLSSKLFQHSVDQALTATRLARTIEEQEARVRHRRTLVVGDLNMNPFEPGVAGGEALHAVMDKQTALKVSRVISGEPRLFFYNPMWGRLGDGLKGPPGTYYRQSSEQVTYFWNTYDQVLLRPELVERFRDEDLKVLTAAGSVSLLTSKGTPNSAAASDHLPIMFSLNLTEAPVRLSDA